MSSLKQNLKLLDVLKEKKELAKKEWKKANEELIKLTMKL